MTKTRVTVTLDPDVEDWLRAGASSGSKSLSDTIRICLREYAQINPTRFSRADRARTATENAWLRSKCD